MRITHVSLFLQVVNFTVQKDRCPDAWLLLWVVVIVVCWCLVVLHSGNHQSNALAQPGIII